MPDKRRRIPEIWHLTDVASCPRSLSGEERTWRGQEIWSPVDPEADIDDTRQLILFQVDPVYLTAMSEEDDPLMGNGDWHRLSISFDPMAMEQMGPNLQVSIAAVTEKETTLAHHEVSALVDTGSKSSCISPRLAPRMEGGVRGVRSLPHIYGLLEGPPTIRGLVRFKNGIEFIRDFSVLDQLAPYDVLIGRDILREGRMYIDGGTGHFRLYFRKRAA